MCLLLQQVASSHITAVYEIIFLITFYMYVPLLPVAAQNTLSSTPIKDKEGILQNFTCFIIGYVTWYLLFLPA